jgi:glycosyltransferase involved in cell wall biosynthesis
MLGESKTSRGSPAAPGDDVPAAPVRRKRLLVIAQYFPLVPGGAEYQAYCLARYFRARMDVHYLCMADGALASDDPDIRISAIRSWGRWRRILGPCRVLDYFRVVKAMRRIHPDFIYERGASPYLGIAARYARTSGCTLICHIASERNVQRLWYHSLRTMLFDYLDRYAREYGLRHARYIFGQAAYEDRMLLRNFGRPCDLIIGNWHPEPAPPCAKAPPIKVVWIANIKPLKQPELFADLAERLRELAGVEFLMVGRPTSGRYQRCLDARLRRVRNLRYLGEKPIEEINRILAGAHLLVNTSDYEGFPNTFIQAWLHEVPVVSLHVDPDDVLKTEGLGFHSGSFDQLVRDTKSLIEDADLRTRMGARTRAYALEKHSLTKNLERVAEFLGV